MATDSDCLTCTEKKIKNYSSAKLKISYLNSWLIEKVKAT